MSVFKKKNEAPVATSSIQDKNNKLNLLLGLGSSQCPIEQKKGFLNRDLIMACAMFWDSKKRIDRIKSLVLKEQELIEFNSTDNFEVSQLMSIELLSLSKNNIMHLQPLSVLDTLICLNINHNKVYDLSPLSQLTKLEQLYASNNQITHIDPLKSLSNLRIVNLFSNKINRVEETLQILSALKALQELDIEQNPVYSFQVRGRFLALQKLIRFNGDLILEQERSDLGIMSASLVVLPSAKFRDTHTSFFSSNKSQIKTNASSKSSNKVKTKSEIYSHVLQLENKYLDIDDKFQEQIVKNVQLKSEYQRQLEYKKTLERQNQDIKEKDQEITLLKRKVKMLKENLFNNPETQRKCELLRQLFDLEMAKQLGKPSIKAEQTGDKNLIWVRKFDFDEEVIMKADSDEMYLMQEDEEIAMLLTQNSSAIQQLKKELREISS